MFNEANLPEFSTLCKKSANELADWILDCLKTNSFAPLVFFDEPSTLLQFRDLYFRAPTSEQAKFRTSAIIAFQKWHPKNQGLSVIEDLALLCSYTRIYDVLDNIRFIIEQLSENEDHYDHTLSILYGVVGGFAPSTEVEYYLERFFYSPHTSYKFVPQLFLALCVCKPQMYPTYLPRVLHVITKNSKYFRLEYIIAEFVRLVGLSTVAEKYSSISKEYRNLFLDFLGRKDWSPTEILLTQDGIFIKPRPSYLALGPEYSNDVQMHRAFFLDEFPENELTSEYDIIYRVKENNLNHRPVQFIESIL